MLYNMISYIGHLPLTATNRALYRAVTVRILEVEPGEFYVSSFLG